MTQKCTARHKMEEGCMRWKYCELSLFYVIISSPTLIRADLHYNEGPSFKKKKSKISSEGNQRFLQGGFPSPSLHVSHNNKPSYDSQLGIPLTVNLAATVHVSLTQYFYMD